MNRLLAATLAGFLLSGCVGAVPRLRSEWDDPARSQVLARYESVRKVVTRVPVTLPSGHRTTVEVEERGTGTAERLVVLVHGVMSDRRTWRYVAADLTSTPGIDVLLVDLPGCGGSDAPDPMEVGLADYAPPALSSAVIEAVDARLAARGGVRPQVTLAGHSLGAALLLRCLCEPSPSRKRPDATSATEERTDSLVLFSPIDVAYERPDPAFREMAELKAYEVDAARTLGVLAKKTTEAVISSAREGSSPPREEADRLFEILASPSKRRAGQAILAQACPYLPDGRPDWKRCEEDGRALAAVKKPVLLVVGERDETVPSAYGFRLAARLSNSWLRTVPGGTHPLPTEDAAVCAQAIRDFAREKGAGWPRIGVLSRP